MTPKTFNIEAIIFDMDGVITNTMPDHYRAWKTIFKSHGISITRHEIYEREGQPGLNSVIELFNLHKINRSKKEIKEILDDKESLFKKIAKIRFISGARKFLITLNNNGIKTALVTGTSRDEVTRILPKNVYNIFSVIITGTDVKKGKPHPEPYLKCLSKLQIPKEKAVVIENAPYGILSAKAAGLNCYALETSLPAKYLKNADQIFVSYKDMNSKISFKPLEKIK